MKSSQKCSSMKNIYINPIKTLHYYGMNHHQATRNLSKNNPILEPNASIINKPNNTNCNA